MLILTEKPSVAKDFAVALGCKFRNGFYSSETIEITNCVGHLFRLDNPESYDAKFKSWSEIPIIPDEFKYVKNAGMEKQADLVKRLLIKHRLDSILIATDADREGEIIARECLLESGITDFSRIRRFWVSQALTPEVVRNGIRNARPLSEYDSLAKKGFARQHSDWLVGINFTRYITVAANRRLTVGRVQTAVLSAIEERCARIADFKSEKYFEHYASFTLENNGTKRNICQGIYFEDEGGDSFPDDSREALLKSDVGIQAVISEEKSEKREIPAPQLYNLNAVQKETFKLYGFSADKTLKVIQSLYEEHKCVSYPRTPSRVMGSDNVELCKKIWRELSAAHTEMSAIESISDISLSNKRVFNDAKLEAHHALIPLKEISASANDDERKIYELILNRFMLAFAAPCVYNIRTAILSVNGHKYRISGKRTIDNGWKTFEESDATRRNSKDEQEEEEQDLSGIDLNKLRLSNIEAKEKWTRPPKHFDEASMLGFMENPKSEREDAGKLVGLGTQATRHSFLPKLKACGYIEIENKSILITSLGKAVLNAVRASPIKSIADVSETTNWEKSLEENPSNFERKIREFVRQAVAKKMSLEISRGGDEAVCPKCGKPMRKGNRNWYCAGYKDGCDFKIWETIAGTKISKKDIFELCSGKKTATKKFTGKGGKEFKARLFLNESLEVKFNFDK